METINLTDYVKIMTKYQLPDRVILHYRLHDSCRMWLNENHITYDFNVVSGDLRVGTKEDAMAFKLKWT